MEICPLTGQPCPFQKQIHITDLKDGVVQESHCCKKCHEKFITEGPQPTPVAIKEDPNLAKAAFNLLSAIFAGLAPTPKKIVQEDPLEKMPPCPGCGITLREIADGNGRLGCPQCWSHFEKELDIILENAHRAKVHTGKRPKTWQPPEPEQEVQSLQEKLAEAIRVENYEAAAVLKQKIESLEND